MNREKVAKELLAIAKELTSLYWGGTERVYRTTKREQADGVHDCPKCKGSMERHPFTKREKIFICPGCGFKIPSSKVVTKRVVVDIEPDGAVEVSVASKNSPTNGGA